MGHRDPLRTALFPYFGRLNSEENIHVREMAQSDCDTLPVEPNLERAIAAGVLATVFGNDVSCFHRPPCPQLSQN